MPETSNSYVSVYDLLRHAVPDIEPDWPARMSALLEAEHGHGAGVRTPRGADDA